MEERKCIDFTLDYNGLRFFLCTFVENNHKMRLIHQQNSAQKEVANRRSCINKEEDVDAFQ